MLPVDVLIYVTLTPELMTLEHRAKAAHVKNPVFKLLRQEEEWKLLKTHVKLGEIAPVDGLGVNNSITPQGCAEEVKINMCNYLRQAVGMYEQVAGAPALKAGVSLPWRTYPLDEPERLKDEGIIRRSAASLLMKLLSIGNACRPDIVWSIITLSMSQTKWTRQDLQLCHLYSYVKTTAGLELVNTLSFRRAQQKVPVVLLYLKTDGTRLRLDWSSKLQG
eukprot:1344317-Amphidinium_carterae.3